MTKSAIENRIKEKQRVIEKAPKELNFLTAAQLRDEIKILKEKVSG